MKYFLLVFLFISHFALADDILSSYAGVYPVVCPYSENNCLILKNIEIKKDPISQHSVVVITDQKGRTNTVETYEHWDKNIGARYFGTSNDGNIIGWEERIYTTKDTDGSHPGPDDPYRDRRNSNLRRLSFGLENGRPSFIEYGQYFDYLGTNPWQCKSYLFIRLGPAENSSQIK